MDMLRGGFMPGLLGNGMGVVGAGSSYQAETEAIAAAFTTPPTTARKDLIDAAVVALKSAGVWTKLDALYAFAAADSQAALINWKAPGTFNCTEVNAPVFTADQGFTGASTKYLDSGFNPTTAPSPKFVQDSASAFAWSNTNVQIIGGIIGENVATASTTTMIYPRYNDNNVYSRINQATANVQIASSDSTGFWSINRSASNLQTLYKNASSLNTNATASNAPTNASMKFLIGSVSEPWTGQCCGGGIGSSLNSTEQTALYNALRTYLTGVGVP